MKKPFHIATFVILLSCAAAAQDGVTALWELLLAPDAMTVQKHLSNDVVQAITECDPTNSQERLKLAVFPFIEGMGRDATRKSEGVVVLRDIWRGGTVELRLASSEVAAQTAVFGIVVTRRLRGGRIQSNQSLLLTMELQDREWRLVSVATEEDGRPSIHNLREIATSCRMANESSAIGSMRVINVAQFTYHATYPERGFAERLSQLAPPEGTMTPHPGAAGLVDSVLACKEQPCVKSGYRFWIDVAPEFPHKSYKVFGRPLTYGKTGMRSFYTDSTGVIRLTTEDRAANANDPMP